MLRLDPHGKPAGECFFELASVPRDTGIQRLATLAPLTLMIASPALAGDWPQILGPTRNGTAEGEQLLAKWPASGPRQLWSKSVGEGYAGVAVRGKQAILFHRLGNKDRIESLDAGTGLSQWSFSFDTNYRGGLNPDNGPRCAPLIHGDSVYVVGASGDVHCLALKNGDHRWSREASVEYRVPDSYFGAGSSPIVANDKLLLNVGGRDGAGLVAFQLKDGKTAWKATAEGASYSSPISARVDGKQRVVFVTRLNAIAVDPANGEVAFRVPFGKRGATVNAASPLLVGDSLFLSASYGIGARMVRLGAKPKEIWSDDETMSSQYTTCVHRNGALFGTHGREDSGDGSLRCVDAKTGKVRWSDDGFGLAHAILVKDRLLLQTVDGRVVLAKANPDRYEELASKQLVQGVTRSLPALSNGRLFVRVNAGRRSKLICLQVGE